MGLLDGIASLETRSTTVTGTNVQFTTGTFVAGVATTLSGTTAQYTAGVFSNLSGTSIRPTNVIMTTGSISHGAGYYTWTAGSRFGQTVKLLARNAITGGDLVGASGGEAYALGAFAGNASKSCLGVAVSASPVASGGTAEVLVNGIYDLAASMAVTSGDYVFQSSGTNAVGTGTTKDRTTFGRALTDTASGAVAVIYVNA